MDGWHASKTVIADGKGLHDLHQSLHECLYLPGLVTTFAVVWGAGIGARAGKRVDNIAGALAALLCSSRR